MAQGDTPITVVGNLVADPELRFIPSGAAVANFRIASTPRTFNRETNQWEDGEALFLTCNCWRQMAENVAESLTKGMRVVVTGKLRQRSYQTKEGENRTVFEVEVDEVGPSLKYASASVTRNPREGGAGGYGGGNQGGQRGGFDQGGQGGQGQNQGQGGYNPANGGFGGQSQGQTQGNPNQSQPQHDPWGSAPDAGGFSGGAGDEPPF
ncbi:MULTISPECIES: single-stranded DNA-binding protein [unclassified Corynebacterium]|uniref:single-stranded DNA-binding protein n=1 Tax=unclassified Corynebacterium TaxID=2624378 RepID=UPI001EF5E82C|nr:MULTISPECIES: single-stranded DNA-binding protein [unclassified Corynebacterium]MCG7290550.1 single-stranded DNA-binding protein [Corynebacterium sp. ACRPZ]MCG7295036.1 single-stranded DNA-binding protein [Corynebacterium sp. ACRPY]